MKTSDKMYSQQSTPVNNSSEDLELSLDDLDTVVGGQMSQLYKSKSLMAGCTGGTRSVCHIDGTDDADSAF